MKNFLKKLFGKRLIRLYHYIFALVSAVIYRFPSRKLFVVGVTGTKGKSTVVEIINSILENAGKKTALLSSIRIKVGERSEKNATGNTMPGRFFIQRFLSQAANAGCDYAILEVTSQGVVQYRQKFIDWDAGIITNLEPEHIEAHGSFEKYRQSKVGFFKAVAKSKKDKKLFLINKNLKDRNYFEKEARGETVFFDKSDLKKENLNTWLLADFNLENAAAAVALAKYLKIDDGIVENTLKEFSGVPGRLEIIQEKPFRVIIDYAHTPDSLEQLYESLKPSKLICVLGAAAGGRDRWKRPIMGNIAAQHCEKIILTNEDPYDEDPNKILSEIKSGISNFNSSDTFEILDRKEAIKKAVSLAKKGDTVVLTGKGSELWMNLSGGKRIPWNEKAVAKEILRGEG